MKTAGAMLAVLCVLLFSGCADRTSERNQKLEQTQIGRYQLLQGYYTYPNGDEKDIFKIDTVTGNVWVYSPGFINNTIGKVMPRYWELIPDIDDPVLRGKIKEYLEADKEQKK